MKLLITGISGFAARHFIEMLSEMDSSFEVAGIYFRNLPHFSETAFANIRCKFYKINLLEEEAVKDLLAEFKPDHILHLAAKSSVSESWIQPAACIKDNTTLFLNIVEQVRLQQLPCRILSVGSTEEYGNVLDNKPLVETSFPLPVSPYGASRMMQQKLVEIYSKNYAIDILHTRSFNHIGPYQDPQFVISSFAKQIATQILAGNNAIELVVGDVEVVRDFTDVRDVVKAYYQLLLNGKTGETYNVCSNRGYVLKEMIALFGKVAGKNISYKTDKKNFRPSENKIIIGSFEKLQAAVGWAPHIQMEKTLTDMLEYWTKKLS